MLFKQRLVPMILEMESDRFKASNSESNNYVCMDDIQDQDKQKSTQHEAWMGCLWSRFLAHWWCWGRLAVQQNLPQISTKMASPTTTKSWPEKPPHHAIMFVWMLIYKTKAIVHPAWMGCDWDSWLTSYVGVGLQYSRICPKISTTRMASPPPTNSWPQKLPHHAIMFVWMLYNTKTNKSPPRMNGLWLELLAHLWCDAGGRAVKLNLSRISTKMASPPPTKSWSEKLSHHDVIMFVWMLYKTNHSPSTMNGLWLRFLSHLWCCGCRLAVWQNLPQISAIMAS